eukprot:10481002-Prorocentrum_lima.AAC.1
MPRSACRRAALITSAPEAVASPEVSEKCACALVLVRFRWDATSQLGSPATVGLEILEETGRAGSR